MKATTFLVLLALVALAAAADQSGATQSWLYASTVNYYHGLIIVGNYLNCYYVGAFTAFLYNDGGSYFYQCLVDAGVTKEFTTVVAGDAVPSY